MKKGKKLSHRIRSKEIGTSVKVIPERSSVKRREVKSFFCEHNGTPKATLCHEQCFRCSIEGGQK